MQPAATCQLMTEICIEPVKTNLDLLHHHLPSFCVAEMATSDTLPIRKATNITLDAELLEQARGLKINISHAAQEGVSRAVAAKQAAIWLQENQAALDSSNAYGDQNGLPLIKHRNF